MESNRLNNNNKKDAMNKRVCSGCQQENSKKHDDIFQSAAQDKREESTTVYQMQSLETTAMTCNLLRVRCLWRCSSSQTGSCCWTVDHALAQVFVKVSQFHFTIGQLWQLLERSAS